MGRKIIRLPFADDRDAHWWRDRLDLVDRDGDDFMAACPAHDDSNPSLHVTARGGGALVTCFAGCEYDDILAAVEDDAPPRSTARRRFHPKDGGPEPKRRRASASAARPRAVAEGGPLDWWAGRCGVPREYVRSLPLEERRGWLAFTFDGTEAAKLRQADEDGDYRWDGAVSPPLWPMPPLAMPPLMIVTEGEGDATVIGFDVHQSGLGDEIAVHSATKGSKGTVTRDVWRKLAARGLKRVMVLFDEDRAGDEGAQKNIAEATAAGLRATRAHLEGLDPLLGEKDARDVWLRALLADESAAIKLAETKSAIRTMAELAAMVPNGVEWVIEHVAYRGGVTLVAGPAKGGKSTWLRDAIRRSQAGEPFLGAWAVAADVPALLLTEEGALTVVNEAGDLRLDVVSKRLEPAASWTLAEALAAVVEWLDSHVGGLVVIDTLAAWAGIEDENDAAATTAAIQMVSAVLASRGAAVVIVHHTRKGGGDYGEGIRGSTAILAAVDLAAELTYVSPGNDRRWLSLRGRFGGDERHQLDFDRATRRYSLVDPVAERDAETDAWLAAIPEEGALKRDLEKAWNLSDKPTRARIKKLLALGRISEVEEDSRGTKRYFLVELPTITYASHEEVAE